MDAGQIGSNIYIVIVFCRFVPHHPAHKNKKFIDPLIIFFGLELYIFIKIFII
jgi:hypothetical protein